MNYSIKHPRFLRLLCIPALAFAPPIGVSELNASNGDGSSNNNSSGCSHQNHSTADPFLLGEAAEFSVIGSTTITNTGETTLSGKYGVTPGSAVTGLPGTQSDATSAKPEGQAAYLSAKNAVSNFSYGDVFDIGGLTLTPGVHTFPSSVFVTGNLTLDFQGDPDAVFIFQMESTLITAAGPGATSVTLTGGGSAENIFWQVGSSATISTYSDFAGNIVALTSISMKTGAALDGRCIALNGAVTLEGNRLGGGGGIQIGSGGTVENPVTYHLPSWDICCDVDVVGPVMMVIDGDVNIGSNAVSISGEGSLELYVGGNISVEDNGGFNNTLVPSKLALFGTHPAIAEGESPAYSWTLNGSSVVDLSTVVYAPNVEYIANNEGSTGVTHGAIVAMNIEGSPGLLHYDEALVDFNFPFGDYSFSSYKLMRNGQHTPRESAQEQLGSSDYSKLFGELFED